MIKKLIQNKLGSLLQYPLFRLVYWYLRAPFSSYSAFAFYKERTARDLRTNSEYRVLIGPYKGMRYTKHGSSISLNCLLGSYEMEIWPALNSLKSNNYDLIVDVGCAEGYHACGMALLTQKPVLAYDINSKARVDCKQMARLNGVSSLVEVREFLSCEELEELCGNQKTFLFCDIDYYELELLDPAKVPSLGNTDILVETHGHAPESANDTMPVIQDRFQDSHDIELLSIKPRNAYLMWDHVDSCANDRFAIGKVVDEPLCHAFFEERGWNNWLWLRAKNRRS